MKPERQDVANEISSQIERNREMRRSGRPRSAQREINAEEESEVRTSRRPDGQGLHHSLVIMINLKWTMLAYPIHQTANQGCKNIRNNPATQ